MPPVYQFSSFSLDPKRDAGLISEQLAPEVSFEDKRTVCKRAWLTLGLESAPVLLALVEGVGGGITGQIAAQLAIDAIVDRALEVVEESPAGEEETLVSRVIREAFKKANQEVYRYAHKMQAGGRVAADGFVAAFDGTHFSVARVGPFEGFVSRSGEVVELYERKSSSASAGTLDRFIGANAQILVDVATLNLRDGDMVILTTFPGDAGVTAVVEEVLSASDNLESAAAELVFGILGLSVGLKANPVYQLERDLTAVLLHVGRPVISLKKVVVE